MKLHADSLSSLNTITAYGADYLEINRQQRYPHSVLIMPQGPVQPWEVNSYEQLNKHHFDILGSFFSQTPELIIFGSGRSHRFPPLTFLQTWVQQNIGIETMDTQAACRTYNILVAEGRQVLAALLLDNNNMPNVGTQ